MKKVITILVLFATLCLAGCIYDVPLAEKQDLPLDVDVIGNWQSTGPDAGHKLTITSYSETEYAFHFPKGFLEENRTFLRGYPIKVGGVSLIQLVRTDSNYVPTGGSGAYSLITLEVVGAGLAIKVLELGDSARESKSSAGLRAIFLSKKDDKSIYQDGGKFSRVAGQEAGRAQLANRLDDAINLRNAVRKGDLATVQNLLAQGVAIDAKDENGDTALGIAAIKGFLPLVQVLLAHGAGLEIQDNEGFTALMGAAQEGHLEIVTALLTKGAKADAQNNKGATALMSASSNGHLPVIQTLLAKGANVNAKDNDGDTRLMYASNEGHLPVVRTLLIKGANVNAKNNDGVTPLKFASNKGHLPVVQALLLKGADVSAKDNYGFSPLMSASIKGHLPVVRALLIKGANVNDKDNEGFSPLIVAAQEGHLEVVEALLNKGAAVNAQNSNGTTALMLAAKNGHLPVVQALLAKGAEANVDALYLAKAKGHAAIVQLLEQEVRKCPANLSTEHLFRVNSYEPTGVAVGRGDRLIFEASGRVSFGAFAGSGGPQGINGFAAYSYFSDWGHGALMGRIRVDRQSGWFLIGAERIYVSGTEGLLELDVNDREAGNNSGSFEVKVNICRARRTN